MAVPSKYFTCVTLDNSLVLFLESNFLGKNYLTQWNKLEKHEMILSVEPYFLYIGCMSFRKRSLNKLCK